MTGWEVAGTLISMAATYAIGHYRGAVRADNDLLPALNDQAHVIFKCQKRLEQAGVDFNPWADQ